mmetsp:Transcript_68859/g.212960  ORF Transcript_68859/g.212960 Transcript_68859/m.212960 type:complete len:270 (-) Transcript_68859:2-811(-)
MQPDYRRARRAHPCLAPARRCKPEAGPRRHSSDRKELTDAPGTRTGNRNPLPRTSCDGRHARELLDERAPAHRRATGWRHRAGGTHCRLTPTLGQPAPARKGRGDRGRLTAHRRSKRLSPRRQRTLAAPSPPDRLARKAPPPYPPTAKLRTQLPTRQHRAQAAAHRSLDKGTAPWKLKNTPAGLRRLDRPDPRRTPEPCAARQRRTDCLGCPAPFAPDALPPCCTKPPRRPRPYCPITLPSCTTAYMLVFSTPHHQRMNYLSEIGRAHV